MEILKSASAGTMESSDAYVEVEPCEDGLKISLESVVKNQFGDVILKVVREVLEENGVEKAALRVVDRGALDCVIRARVETAVLRGATEGNTLRVYHDAGEQADRGNTLRVYHDAREQADRGKERD